PRSSTTARSPSARRSTRCCSSPSTSRRATASRRSSPPASRSSAHPASDIRDNGPMTQQPFSAAALRGAVDLSALSAARKPAQPGAGAGPDGGAGDLLLHVTDETFTAAVNGTTTVPALL